MVALESNGFTYAHAEPTTTPAIAALAAPVYQDFKNNSASLICLRSTASLTELCVCVCVDVLLEIFPWCGGAG